MSKGYVLINRKIEDHWLWTDKPFTKGQAWIDLIMMANYADSELLTKGRVVQIKRGQVFRTIGFLAERWGWSNKKVRAYLDLLKGQAMVTAEGTTEGTLITIENYETWQTLGQESGHSKGQAKGQARVHKRNKNNTNTKTESVTRTPTFEEIKDYVDQMNYEMDPEAFFDYYEETGWLKKNGQPIRDWKASVRTWARREREFKKSGQYGNGSKPAIEPPKYKEFGPEPKVDAVEMPDDVRAAVKKILK